MESSVPSEGTEHHIRVLHIGPCPSCWQPDFNLLASKQDPSQRKNKKSTQVQQKLPPEFSGHTPCFVFAAFENLCFIPVGCPTVKPLQDKHQARN